MSEASKRYQRQSALDYFAERGRLAEAWRAKWLQWLETIPAGRALLADPEWAEIQRKRLEISDRFAILLAPYRGDRFYEEYSPDEQATIDRLHRQRDAELQPLAALQVELQHDYAIPKRPTKPQAAPPLPDPIDGKPAGTTEATPDKLLSHSELADLLGIPKDDYKTRETLRKRLEAWKRRNLEGGWVEVKDAKPREPRYLYPAKAVWPAILNLKPSG